MNDLLRSPLGPAIVLLVASILLRVLASPRRPAVLALLTVPPLLISLLLLTTLRDRGSVVSALNWWPLVTPSLRVQWVLDGWNWLSALLLLLLGMSALLMTWRIPAKRSGAYHGLSFALLAAALITVVSDNLMTAGAAWVATDILLVARTRGSRAQGTTAPVWLEVAGSLLMLVSISITSLSTASTTLTAARLPQEPLALLLVVAALRMAAYPLHIWLAPSGVPRDRGTQVLINGLGLVTGGWLMGRIISLGGGNWLTDPLWQPLAVLVTLLAGFAAWTTRPHDRFALLSSSRAAWLWAVVAMTPLAAARDALGWALASVVLALILVAAGEEISERWHWDVPALVAAATLAGVPFTTGMPVRAWMDASQFLLLLLLVVADSLAVATVLENRRAVLKDSPAPASASFWLFNLGWPAIRLLVAVGLALVPNLLWGVQPTRLAREADFTNVLSFGRLLLGLGIGHALALVLTLALGVGFYQLAHQPNFSRQPLQRRLAAVVSLNWAVNGARWLLQWAELGARNILAVVEGEGYLGWVVLALLLAALIMQI